MVKNIFLIFCITMIFTACDSNDLPQLGKSPVNKVIAAMTLEEKAQLLVGMGMAGFSGETAVVGQTQEIVPGAAGTTYAIPRLGIPAIVVADGPAGLRIQPVRKDDPDTYYCTAFPVGTLLASTWNTELVETVGQAMGNEVLEYGVDVILGPALNIQRNPLCGRNFEYYSEDPLLSGKITAAMVNGIQSNGVGVSIKHFAANNQETNRMANDSRMTVRALREIYLKGFEIAVIESNPLTIMSSYNFINGVYASESRELLIDILRDDWGFRGLVMTDWFGGKNPPAQVHAGNDLLMPGNPQQYEAILAAVNAGTLSIADIDANVKRILNTILETPVFKGYPFSNKPDLKAHAQITRQSASEGMVLLKNEGNTLPFAPQVQNIAAFGITSYELVKGGTGSGDVNNEYVVSLKEGLVNSGYTLDAGLTDLYETHLAAENLKNAPNPADMLAMFMPKTRPTELQFSASQIADIVRNSDIALITIGRNSGEFLDRQITNDFELSADEQTLLQMVSEAYHATGKKVVVVLNIGGVIETASWKTLPDAILLAWQAGQEGGNSIADILKGSVNPSGKLPMTFPDNYFDMASSANFPYDYQFDMRAMMGAFTGQTEEKKEPVHNVDFTNYEEDIYVGYRYFDTFDKAVSFPFGYGLSYTSFAYENPTIDGRNGNYTLTVTVKNTGATAGKEVVQLYISAPALTMHKPAKELKAFSKTKLLQPDESQTLTFKITPSDLASFDQNASAWNLEAGNYTAHFGASVNEILQNIQFSISREMLVEKVKNVLTPKETINVIR